MPPTGQGRNDANGGRRTGLPAGYLSPGVRGRRPGPAQPAPPPPDEPWTAQSLAQGAAGIALLHVERAHARLGPWRLAHKWIAQAASGDVSAADTTGLFLGAPAVAFLLNTTPTAFNSLYSEAWTTLHAHVTALAHRRTDTALARMFRGDLPTFAEYDVFYGLTGIGVYLLRSDPSSSALERILSYLVSLTHPVDSDGHRLPGWWVGHDPRRGHSTRFRLGHGNLGAAHGITGPLLLLAQALRRGISVEGHQEAIRTICFHLDGWRQDGVAGPWWPEHLTLAEFDTYRTHHHGPGRPSWCYGTLGIARAGQLAGIALNNPALQRSYEDALYRSLTDPTQLAQVTDTSLCHGWAGIYQTAFRAAHDALNPHLHNVLQPLGEALSTHARPGSANGPGLIDGDAGCALALTPLAADQAPTTGWDACLLID
ncbi:lanthionine synthetase C family protein [Streptomyces lunaelactis]|nr:lanthionine synthetase C family protein [Streptomyces lunaelactis]NUK15627.1 lanthionine synthetase C family protein [Streptomyces lunaelactis]NUK22605.1 lanthionine synthetase C family protein [Streptomyces lunaelactis]NUK57518.1 lanthionine synthetase C family protein [Streptomyces lunaelactis]NUL11371.1 lanthionine synthetase C family protein [Streptomyces lunaelactis]